MREDTLKEPGCVFMHLTQPQDDPGTWVMLEMFRSRAAWDDHMGPVHVTEGNRILEDLLREPSDLRLLDELQPRRRPAAVGRRTWNRTRGGDSATRSPDRAGWSRATSGAHRLR